MTLRLLVAIAVAAAIGTDTTASIDRGELARHVSFFTNQSNAAFVLVTVLVAAFGARRPAWLETARGAVTFYLAMTGLVYAFVVAPVDELMRWDIGWTGIVLHRVAPVAAVADWVLTPRQHRAGPRRILIWLAYPVVYVAFTWIRGGLTGWYPYAFLDPSLGGWGAMLPILGVVLFAFLLVATVLHFCAGRLAARRAISDQESRAAVSNGPGSR